MPPCEVCPGISDTTAHFGPKAASAENYRTAGSDSPGSAPGRLCRAESSHSSYSESPAVLSATPNLMAFNHSLKSQDPRAMQLRGNREQVLAFQELGPGFFVRPWEFSELAT